MKKIKKIKKLDIKINRPTEEDYNHARAKYIAGYTEYKPGGFFSNGYDEHKPDVAEAKWNSLYPEGYKDWITPRGDKLSSYGEQLVIEKINEIIERLNDSKD